MDKDEARRLYNDYLLVEQTAKSILDRLDKEFYDSKDIYLRNMNEETEIKHCDCANYYELFSLTVYKPIEEQLSIYAERMVR